MTCSKIEIDAAFHRGYVSGTASRDAELAELKKELNAALFELDNYEMSLAAATSENDQLRKDVERLNKLVIEAKQAFDGVNVDSRWFDRGMAILDEALAATEQTK